MRSPSKPQMACGVGGYSRSRGAARVLSHYGIVFSLRNPVVTPTTDQSHGDQTKEEGEKGNKKKRKKRDRHATGGAPPGKGGQKVEGPKVEEKGYPLGERLRAAEFEASKLHGPRESTTGKPFCWNFNSNAGCAAQGAECEHGLHRLMKQSGLHWAARAQIARRGGFKGTQLMSAAQIDGFIQSLRDTEQLKVDAIKTNLREDMYRVRFLKLPLTRYEAS